MASKSRAKKAIGKTTNLTASRGNAGKNKAQSILRQIRENASRPSVLYNYRGNLNARQRREYVSNLMGTKLSSRVHVRFDREKSLDKVSKSGGIRRTLEGYRISYSYS